jgi:hypothetical protein
MAWLLIKHVSFFLGRAGLALRVTGTHKPLYHGKMEILTKGLFL